MDDIPINENPVLQKINMIRSAYQKYLDQSTPHVSQRWTAFGGLLFIFIIRILFAQGWYIICYGLGIYLLNLFLAFLQPKFDPSLEQEQDKDSLESGEVETTEEFRPFIRRLPEFKFWHRATVSTLLSLLLTSTELTDVPVFWPILLMYFILLFVLTMRRQIQHMVKYRYIPLDIGKKKYGPK